MEKPPTWESQLKQVWTQVPHRKMHDPGKLNHALGYALAKFCLGRMASAPKGLTQVCDIAQAQLILICSLVLPAEPNSCQIPLFLGREQHNNETVITSLSFSKEIPLTVLKECFDVYKLQQNYLNEKMFFSLY